VNPIFGIFVFIAAGVTYLLTRKSFMSPLPPLSSKKIGFLPSGEMEDGTLHRIKVLVHPRYQEVIKSQKRSGSVQSYLTEVLKEKLRRLGFSQVLLATSDPTDSRCWTFLARSSGSGIKRPSKGPFRIFSISAPLNEPPDLLPDLSLREVGEREDKSPLDDGLSPKEVEALIHALAFDDDPKHLGGFASTLDPDFPVASALLYVKAKLATARASGLGSPDSSRKDDFEGMIDATCTRNAMRSFRELTQDMGKDVQAMWTKYEPIANVMTGKHCEVLMKKIEDAKKKRARPSPIPTSAIQLVYAQKRPQLSHVSNVKKIVPKLKAIHTSARAGEPDGEKAKDILARAERLLERRTWVEWYRRIRDVQSAQQGGPAPGSITRRS